MHSAGFLEFRGFVGILLNLSLTPHSFVQTQQFKIPEKPQLAGVSTMFPSLFYSFIVVVIIGMTLFTRAQDTAEKSG